MSSEVDASRLQNNSIGWRFLRAMGMPVLATITAFLVGAVVILITSGDITAVPNAYWGMIRGALIKERGLSESLVATIPYVFLSLGLAVGFKSGLFNIGVEGQYLVGAISAAWAGQVTHSLPAIIHLPFALLAGALGGAIWSAIPGYLKVRTGAHEVISTMMLNYVALLLAQYLVMVPLRDHNATAIETPSVSHAAELWTLYEIPARLKDPLNALGVALLAAFLGMILARWWISRSKLNQRLQTLWSKRRAYIGFGLLVGVIFFVGLPPLTRAWWPFNDVKDRLHIGLFLAVLAAIGVWWLMWKTTLGFELRMGGANPDAAQYAGANIMRNVVLAMAISGGLAGLAGTVEEVLSVSICRCLQLPFNFFGYGFDSIAISLLAKNNPFGILAASFLFGSMRNGADLMELSSGVSKYIISLIQALVLLFMAAPAIMRWLYRIRGEQQVEEETPLTRGWGG